MAHRVRFGPYEFDPVNGDLRKHGHLLRLQPQPAKVLALLVSRPGELIKREQFQREIWGDKTFVDFERGLNFCVRQLRVVLDDDQRNRRFIETAPRRGYRFVATVSAAPQQEVDLSTPPPLSADRHPVQPARGKLVPLLLATMLALALAILWLSPSHSSPRVLEIKQLTNDGDPKTPAGACCTVLANDGARVYFSAMSGGRWVLKQVAAVGGEAAPVPVPAENARIGDLSPQHSRLLILGWQHPTSPILAMDIPGASIQQVDKLFASDVSYSADGGSLVLSKGGDLFAANAEGGEPRSIASLKGRVMRPRWSPDKSKLRFTLYDPATGLQSIWEIASGEKRPHPLFLDNDVERDECCGAWTPDGKYFIYQSTRNHVTNLWAIREHKRLFGFETGQPEQLTESAMRWLGPSVSPDGNRVFAVGYQARGELMRYDRDAHQFVPYLNGMSAEGLDFSKDGQWMVYVSYPDGALWRSRLDGSQRLRLTPALMWASLPRWSPDGKRIVFTGSKAGKRMKAYTVLAEGGHPEPMIEGDGPEFDAAWSPDGKSLVFAESYQAPVPALHLLDFESRRTTTIEDSQGLFSPRWSPGGDYIAALTVNSFNLQVFDMRLRRWRALVLGRHASYPCWSTDGKYLYFLSVLTATTDFYRVRVNDGLLELVAKVEVPKGLAAGFSGRWTGLGPGDNPLLLRDTSIQEIFALTVKWP